MDNFSNRSQSCVALDAAATAKPVVFHASVKSHVRQIRVIFPEAISSHDGTNNVELQIQKLSGTTFTDLGTGITTESDDKAAGEIVQVTDLDTTGTLLEKGDSIAVSITKNGTGAGRFSVAVDAEILGSR